MKIPIVLVFGAIICLDSAFGAIITSRTEICEGQQISIGCINPGTTMRILHGFYGRSNKYVCSIHNQPTHNTNCSNPGAKRILEKLCNGRSICHLDVSNHVFGDPCFGTYKYLAVEYECQ